MQIQNIVSDFQAKSNISMGEVRLFRELADSITRYSNSIFIDETHGNVAQVQYASPNFGLCTCEISDLLILSVSGDRATARATFWQAKKETRSKWLQKTEHHNFDFTGQLNQWELLSTRPSVTGLGRFRPPSDILSAASSPSIGSYGVFYDDHQQVELNYSVAELVAAAGTSSKSRMVINEHLDRYSWHAREALTSRNLVDFLHNLSSFRIGALLNPQQQSHAWLLHYVRRKTRFDLNILNMSTPDIPDIDDLGESEGDGVSVLLVVLEAG